MAAGGKGVMFRHGHWKIGHVLADGSTSTSFQAVLPGLGELGKIFKKEKEVKLGGGIRGVRENEREDQGWIQPSYIADVRETVKE